MTTTAAIAQALVADLNAHAFSLSFTAVRAYLPVYDLGEMATLHVTVVPVGRTLQPATRALLQIDHRIEIAIQQQVAVDVVATVDPVLALVEEIADHLAGHRLAATPEAQWVKTEHLPFVAAEHLNDLRQITSVVAVTYRTWESR